MSESIIEVRDLSRRFGRKTALDAANLEVRQAKCTG